MLLRCGLVSLNRASAVESGCRWGGRTGPCSLVAAGVIGPVPEYSTHGRRAGLRQARTGSRATAGRACAGKESEEPVCFLSDGRRRHGQGARGRLRAGRQERRAAVEQRCRGPAAARHDPAIKAFYERPKSAGRLPRVVPMACMRKLLTTLSAMAGTGKPRDQSLHGAWLQRRSPGAWSGFYSGYRFMIMDPCGEVDLKAFYTARSPGGNVSRCYRARSQELLQRENPLDISIKSRNILLSIGC